jgi:hypothetical protein
MMAIASMLVSDDFFANEPRYWPLDQKVSEYHAARGKVCPPLDLDFVFGDTSELTLLDDRSLSIKLSLMVNACCKSLKQSVSSVIGR